MTALTAAVRHTYDVVHLTGHDAMIDQSPRLVMEDATGDRDDISAAQLLKSCAPAATPDVDLLDEGGNSNPS